MKHFFENNGQIIDEKILKHELFRFAARRFRDDDVDFDELDRILFGEKKEELLVAID